MRDELDKALCEKYPKIFRDRHAPMSQTCMCWGIAVGDGWYNIIDRLCALIQWRIDQSEKEVARQEEYRVMREAALNGDFTLFVKEYGHYKEDRPEYYEKLKTELLGPIPNWRQGAVAIPQVVADQVKEKFGTLRFYYHGGDDVIDGMVQMADALSGVTCEECGAPGKLRQTGWIRCLCDKHNENDAEELEPYEEEE
jgi:hypothetical protein